MRLDRAGRDKATMKVTNLICSMVLVLACGGAGARAQSAEAAPTAPVAVETFYLNNVSQTNDGNEITTALRNLLAPSTKVYFVPYQSAIVLSGTADQLTLAQKLLKDLDRPKKSYRLSYTITEKDGDKRIGTQHFSMVVITGQRTVLKQGSKVPIATGSYDGGKSQTQTQFTYLDVGMNFDATLDEFVNGVRLRSKVEQSSVVEDKLIAGVQEPIIRQTMLEGTSFLTLGKPLMLGSLDIPGSTRHQDVEVVMEQVP